MRTKPVATPHGKLRHVATAREAGRSLTHMKPNTDGLRHWDGPPICGGEPSAGGTWGSRPPFEWNPVLPHRVTIPIQHFETVIGIDPGASGGLAIYRNNESPCVTPMPASEGDLVYLLRALTSDPSRSIAFVELVSGFVGEARPASRAFKFGRGFGFILGVLQERGVRLELVLPGKWQKHFSLGTESATASRTEWKGRLRAEAQRRYPSVKVTMSIADALLILDYGLATLRSDWPEVAGTPSAAAPR